MKMICDVPDEVIASVRAGTWLGSSVLEKMIAYGTPLPKGYGRLIDADALKKDDEVTEWLSLNTIRTGKMLKKFSELFIKKIDDAPTIIEADTESEEQE